MKKKARLAKQTSYLSSPKTWIILSVFLLMLFATIASLQEHTNVKSQAQTFPSGTPVPSLITPTFACMGSGSCIPSSIPSQSLTPSSISGIPGNGGNTISGIPGGNGAMPGGLPGGITLPGGGTNGGGTIPGGGGTNINGGNTGGFLGGLWNTLMGMFNFGGGNTINGGGGNNVGNGINMNSGGSSGGGGLGGMMKGISGFFGGGNNIGNGNLPNTGGNSGGNIPNNIPQF